jgi:Superinfection immunity protein
MPVAAIAVPAVPALAAYLSPSLIACARAVPGSRGVLVLNITRGWTPAGWRRALAAATIPARPRRAQRPAVVTAPRQGSPPPLRLAAGRRSSGDRSPGHAGGVSR